MVEGSLIDWVCHDNNEEEAIRQTILFDEAVKSALEFALKDKHTLVIVTADHETGGIGIERGKLNGENLDIGWLTHEHTGVPVIIYAFGPNAV
ncbi:MAG: alkaline phosphatase, partial [Bacteroidetes bacterium]|nr:alkaline phosphatase [Bacteroidota bacterium]